ncbi:MAG: PIN domain-containing protein [Acidobacteria bacterium]|nr:MAG: PIN domain-containing protein [Acidobacteriota bacterium]
MTAAIDTNVLAYAQGVNDPARLSEAEALLRAIGTNAVLPTIVLAELFYVLIRKGRRTHAEARDIVLEWARVIPVLQQRPHWLNAAVELAAAHRLGIWDAAILDAAADAGCELLLSEDMQHGFRWRGVTVVDPFAQPDHPLLERLRAES